MVRGLIREVQVTLAKVEIHHLSKSGQRGVKKELSLLPPVSCITVISPDSLTIYDEDHLIERCCRDLDLDYKKNKDLIKIHKFKIGEKDLGLTNYELNEKDKT